MRAEHATLFGVRVRVRVCLHLTIVRHKDGRIVGCYTFIMMALMMEAASASETSVNFYQT
jgi:hypothetical protein